MKKKETRSSWRADSPPYIPRGSGLTRFRSSPLSALSSWVRFLPRPLPAPLGSHCVPPAPTVFHHLLTPSTASYRLLPASATLAGFPRLPPCSDIFYCVRLPPIASYYLVRPWAVTAPASTLFAQTPSVSSTPAQLTASTSSAQKE